MEKNCSCDGEISVGAWGSPTSGNEWSYKSEVGIKQIIIRSGGLIDSIIFVGVNDVEASPKFGGKGGNRTEKIRIDFPSEYLTGISGTAYGSFYANNLRSLKIHTNRTEYGPFGTDSGNPFSFNAKGGVITGFHGRAGQYVDAIGVYLKPVCSLHIVSLMNKQPKMESGRCLLEGRSAGPWGSSNDGREWDDGVVAAVTGVHVHLRSDTGVISGVKFLYQKETSSGKITVLSQMHGGRGDLVKMIVMGGKGEFLTGIEGFYGVMKGIVDIEAISCLTFHTNKVKYGPFGSETGSYFSSMAGKGKVVGFHGRSSAYLNAIGVHTDYDIDL